MPRSQDRPKRAVIAAGAGTGAHVTVSAREGAPPLPGNGEVFAGEKPVAAAGTPVIAAMTCCRSWWEPPPHDRATSSAPSCAFRVVDELADRPPGLQALLGAVPGRACAPLGAGRMQAEGAPTMILPKVRDPRFVTIRRGGSLTYPDHPLLALWAATCAEHVLDLFESAQPEDPRPRQAIEHARAWVRGEVKMTQARAAGGHAMGTARDLRGAARHAAYAAGQAGAVAHVTAHELGAAAYAIKAARAAAPEGEGDSAGRLECLWQRDQLPEAIRELVLDDQRLRNDICWSVFDC